MSKPFYLTTTLPYVNAEPHIGFAFELVQADIIARYRKLLGDEVFFNTGTDEHGLKIYRAALEAGRTPQDYVDVLAGTFRALPKALGVSPDIHFIRTSDPRHKRAAQEFWRLVQNNGYIEKRLYRAKYCIGCELEKTDSELEGGRCPIHPNLGLESIEEENYFFKFSAFQDYLRTFYMEHPDFVVPDFRFNEIKAFVERGLEDFSISRLKSKMPWGVEVPDDSNHVMYVWFDALVDYISTLGWPDERESFNKWWKQSGGVVQFAGKDQIRQQAAMWQAMLHAAGLPPSRQIVIHGFITSRGEKMSKSLGNVVDPFALVKAFGTDAVRFYLARHVHPFEDSDFTLEKFKEAYNADLANGLGNLVSRVMTMRAAYFQDTYLEVKREMGSAEKASLFLLSDNMKSTLSFSYEQHLNSYEIQNAVDILWGCIKDADEYIAKYEPFKLIKIDTEKTKRVIWELVNCLEFISDKLFSFIPTTAYTIQNLILEKKVPKEPLFPRK